VTREVVDVSRSSSMAEAVRRGIAAGLTGVLTVAFVLLLLLWLSNGRPAMGAQNDLACVASTPEATPTPEATVIAGTPEATATCTATATPADTPVPEVSPREGPSPTATQAPPLAPSEDATATIRRDAPAPPRRRDAAPTETPAAEEIPAHQDPTPESTDVPEADRSEVVAVELGFDAVQWGTLVPGEAKSLEGDADMSTLDRPTILNTGTVPAYLKLYFQPLQGARSESWITRFGVSFGGETVETSSGVWVCLTTAIPPGEAAAITFWVYPPADITEDVYAGALTVASSALAGAEDGTCAH
jgi:hypothetical protein